MTAWRGKLLDKFTNGKKYVTALHVGLIAPLTPTLASIRRQFMCKACQSSSRWFKYSTNTRRLRRLSLLPHFMPCSLWTSGKASSPNFAIRRSSSRKSSSRSSSATCRFSLTSTSRNARSGSQSSACRYDAALRLVGAVVYGVCYASQTIKKIFTAL